MTNQDKENQIKSLAYEMLEDSYGCMVDRVEKVLRSGAIDIDGWSGNMFLPKCIVKAILMDESLQYSARGTSFEKEVEKTVNNIMYFI